jgi:hypothetical protein
MTKLNVFIDDTGLVHGWGYASADAEVGSVNNGLTVVEVSDISQVVEDHSHFVGGTIKLDEGYVPFDGPPAVEAPSTEQLMINQLGLTVAKLQEQVNALGGDPNV